MASVVFAMQLSDHNFSFYFISAKQLKSQHNAVKVKGFHRKLPHHPLIHWWQSSCCLALAPHVSFNHLLNLCSSFLKTKYCPRTIYALSNPRSASLPPNTYPIPANVDTVFSPIGSWTKFLCFCDVEDIINESNLSSIVDGPFVSFRYKYAASLPYALRLDNQVAMV